MNQKRRMYVTEVVNELSLIYYARNLLVFYGSLNTLCII